MLMNQRYFSCMPLAIVFLLVPIPSFASTIGGWEAIFLIIGIPAVVAALVGFVVGLIVGLLGKEFKFTFYCITISLIVVCLLSNLFGIFLTPPYSGIADLVLASLILLLIGLLPAVVFGYISHGMARGLKDLFF